MTVPVLNLKLLGSMECRLSSGAPLRLPTRKTDVLLAFLALAPGVNHPRERLVNLLWSNRSEEQAKNSFRQSLSTIKKTFAEEVPELLRVDRSSVQLSAQLIRVDVGEFEQLISEPTAENLSKATALYRGAFLEGVSVRDPACQEWLDNERERLSQLLIKALLKLSQLQLSESRYSAAVESIERLLGCDPLQESAWRLLMIANYLNGSRNHALMAYQRCEKILTIELNVHPESATSAVHDQIKSGELNADTLGHYLDEQIKKAASPQSVDVPEISDHMLQGWYHAEKHNPSDTAIAIDHFKKCIESNPLDARAHAVLAAEYHVELFENWSRDRAQTLALAGDHLEKSLHCDEDNALTHAFMAEHMLFQRDFERAAFHADKAVRLDPNLPDSYSMKAMVLAAMRHFDEARKCADISMRLDLHHPYSGWNGGVVYRAVGDYDLAVRTFRRVPNAPPSLHAEIAACLAGLGHDKAARDEMAIYHKLAEQQMPHFPQSRDQWYSLWYENACHQYEDDFNKTFDLFVQAGLCDWQGDQNPSAREIDIPSIAVLPFENLSGDPEQEYFSDGITNDIIVTLSQFKNIRVVARHSTQHYKDKKIPLSEIAQQQGVRYILSGNIRKNANRVRVNAELIDAQGAEISWVEQYDRCLNDIFSVQDDITKNITAAMKVRFSGGKREYQRANGTDHKKAWELCLAAADLQDSYIRENVLEARRAVKKALSLDPEYCDAWVSLGWTYWQEIYCGWGNSFESALDDARKAVKKALEFDPSNAEAWSLSGTIHLMQHELEVTRTVLNP